MFSLIISIIAIALVIVLAGASLYYGGEAFNQGTAKGEFAKIVNEAQQISAGFTLAGVDQDATVVDVTTMVAAGYLSAAPSNAFTVDAGLTTLTLLGVTADVCDAFKKADGITLVNPLADCNDVAGVLTVTYDL